MSFDDYDLEATSRNTTESNDEEREELCSADIGSPDATNNRVQPPANLINEVFAAKAQPDKPMPNADEKPREIKPLAKDAFPADKPFPLPDDKLSPELCESCARHLVNLMGKPPVNFQRFERDAREIFLRLPMKPEPGTMTREH